MGILRFLLALSVVLAHSGPIFGIRLVGGQIAVQAFYIISGFYMTLILNEKYVGANNSYKLFISNRLLRLYPIYWTALLLTILLAIALYFYTNGNDFGNLTYYRDYWEQMGIASIIFLAFTNIFLFLQDTVMFLGLDTGTGNLFFTSNFGETSPPLFRFLLIPQAWTIGVEIAFYLIAPFLVRRKLKIIILLIILSLALRVILMFHFGLKHDPWTYRFFPTELVFFLLGIVAYHIYKKLQKVELKELHLKMIWAAVIAFTFAYGFLPTQIKGLVYLGCFFAALPFVFILTKNWKKDSYIGELSYPIYISHMLVLVVMQSSHFPLIGGLGLTLSILTVLFSILLNKLIANKIEKIRQKRVTSNR